MRWFFYIGLLAVALGLVLALRVRGQEPPMPPEMELPEKKVVLAWEHSTASDVIGYKIFWGPESRNYTNAIAVPYTNSATITNLVAGARYCFAATARNAEGLESDFSNEVSYRVPGGPWPSNTLLQLNLQRSLYFDGPFTNWLTWAFTNPTGSAFWRLQLTTNSGVKYLRLQQRPDFSWSWQEVTNWRKPAAMWYRLAVSRTNFI